ncbi:MAG: hypothetical protein EZS28_051187, partial [Streblomastix strix]
NVKKGDRITKINEPEPGWSMCFIEGKFGYVPTSYIKPVTDTQPLIPQIPQPLPKIPIVAPPTMSWMQEDQYHKYRMIEKLQGGAQGKTFFVERKETNKLFVLKKVDYLDAGDKLKANREVEQMFNLASPFTVQLVCVFPHDVELCLVMEFCEKGDLRKVMTELQQLPEEERLMRVWEILAQIFLAVDHLHSHDVIHRDIKPENIFVMADGSVRVGLLLIYIILSLQ